MRIYNSLTRTKEEIAPIEPGRIGMYVCGPTVYDEPHIGHARSAYIFDVVRRYLAYKGYKVKFVRNVTDVDDKIINKARERSASGGHFDLVEAARAVSKRYLEAYHDDMALIGIGAPDSEPKATEYIPKMIRFIEELISRASAYVSGADVYFDIKKASSYGKLSNQNIANMESGARVMPGDNKRDPLDFALWKGAKEGEPCWESPWGKGRPGWHIECSVMSSDILGDEFDIHGGGIDLIFPHHENEIAQSEGAGKRFARLWMHNGLLTIDGEKMAKSLGNFISIKKFIKDHKDPDYLKLLFLNTHYRHPVDYTEEKISEMKSQKERFIILLDKIKRASEKGKRQKEKGKGRDPEEIAECKGKFGSAMEDDFNTPLALAALFDLVTRANKMMQDKDEFTADETAHLAWIGDAIAGLGGVLGLRLSVEPSGFGADADKSKIGLLIKERDEARAKKDFKAADVLRKRLLDEYGVILEDTKEGTVWRRKV
jgi:cysteinyl-tRNA synthetase